MGNNQRKRGGLNITLVVQDETWRKLGTWKWNSADSGKQNYVIQTIRDSLGVDLTPKKTTTDIDWLKD